MFLLLQIKFNYNRKYPVGKPHKISCFYENEGITAMCFDYGDQYLYFTTDYNNEITVHLSPDKYELSDYLYMLSINGIHIDFEKRANDAKRMEE